MLFGTAFLVAWSVAQAAPETPRSQAGGERYALIIGIGQYATLNPTAFASEDATDLARVLTDVAGYRPERVTLMTQTRAASDLRFAPEAAKIRRELDAILKVATPSDTLLIAFAGHGVQLKGDPEQYFCPADANLEDKTTLIGLRDLLKRLEQSPAGVKLLLADACRDDPRPQNTRALERVQLASLTRPPAVPVPRGVAAYFACSEGQQAHSHPDLKHGVFFHFVMEGLKGAAADKDGVVTADDLAKYLKREVPGFVRQKFGTAQLPDVSVQTQGAVSINSPTAAKLQAGERLLIEGHYNLALKAFDAVLKINPRSADAHAGRAVALGGRRGAQIDKAAEALAEAQRLAPNSARTLRAKGLALSAREENAAALAAFSEAIQQMPNDVISLMNRGRLRSLAGDHAGAIRDFDAARSLAPNLVQILLMRGNARFRNNDSEGGIRDFTEAIRISPSARSYEGRGYIRLNSKDPAGALRDFDEAIRLKPDLASAYQHRAEANRALGQKAKAAADDAKAKELGGAKAE